jgi:enamine deaminase RidA (YjgF/YER057c/UK114 family)
MTMRAINAPDAPAPRGGYAQAVQVDGARRLLFVSGQVPEDPEGNLPADFAGQCRLAWRNVEAQLRAGGMSLDNLVKVTTFLADRRLGIENRQVRQEVLGHRTPALTVIIAGIFEERWLVEIEAVAAE